MQEIGLKYLRYFLKGYWNQMAHDSITENVKEFLLESDEYKLGLVNDIKSAYRLGLFQDEYNHDVYKNKFWSEFDRLMINSDADIVISALMTDGKTT